MLTSQQSLLILSKTITDSKAELHLKIPEDLACFKGHFTDMPVVPGVVQLHWVVEFVKEFFNLVPSITKGSQIKFMSLMKPNDTPVLTLTLDFEKSLITYHYQDKKTTYSLGKLTYET